MTTVPIPDRTAERMAAILGRQQNATGLTYEPDALRPVQAPANDQPARRELGPKQLQWCRDKWPVFAVCERQVLAAERHRQELREAVR